MARGKIVSIGGKPYWEIEKEKEQSPRNKKIKKGIMKGLVGIGRFTIGTGRMIGKEIGRAAENYAAQQRLEKEMQQKQKKDGEKKPQNINSMFPKSGFGDFGF